MNSRSRAGLVALCILTLAACSRDAQALKRGFIESGDKYVAQQKYAEAIIQYRNAVAKDGSDGNARFKLAEAYETTGDLGNALREYIRAADLMPNNVEAQIRAGTGLLATRQFEESRARAAAALAKEPKNVRGLILMGNSLVGLKDLDGAISQLEQAIVRVPLVPHPARHPGDGGRAAPDRGRRGGVEEHRIPAGEGAPPR